MRIIFITRKFYPSVGGVEKHVLEISKTLARQGHKVTVLTESSGEKLHKQKQIKNIKIITIKYPKKKIVGLLCIWVWILINKGTILSNNIIHTHDTALWLLPLKLLNPKIHIYSTFHGWEGKHPLPLKNILLRKLGHLISSKTISVGKPTDKYYKTKSDVIIYGATNKYHGCMQKEKIITYVGRLEADTGLNIFLQALQVLNYKYPTVFCGEGRLKNKCQSYGSVRGFVNPSNHLAKSRICLTGGYLSTLEAIARKCLVLVSSDTELKQEYFTTAPFSKWIVIENNPHKLARKIDYFMRNPQKALPKIKAAYKWVQGQTWEKLTDQYLQLWGIKAPDVSSPTHAKKL